MSMNENQIKAEHSAGFLESDLYDLSRDVTCTIPRAVVDDMLEKVRKIKLSLHAINQLKTEVTTNEHP